MSGRHKTSALDFLIYHATQLVRGSQETVAVLDRTVSSAACRKMKILQAILFAATHYLQLPSCIGARLAHGVQHLGGIKYATDTLLTWWPHLKPAKTQYHYLPAHSQIDCRRLRSDTPAQQLCNVQYLMVAADEANTLQRQLPDMPVLGGPTLATATPHLAKSGVVPAIMQIHVPPPTMQPPATTSLPPAPTITPVTPTATMSHTPATPTPPTATQHAPQPSTTAAQIARNIIASASQSSHRRTRSMDSQGSGNPAPHCSPCLPPEDTQETAQGVPVSDTDEDDWDPDEMIDEDLSAEPEPAQSTFYTPPAQACIDDSETPNTPQDIRFMDNGFVPDTDHDTIEVELIVYIVVAHWSDKCDRQMLVDGVLVLTVSKDNVTAAVRRDCDSSQQQALQPTKLRWRLRCSTS